MAYATHGYGGKWICMADRLPPEGVTFVMTSAKRKARQYVVKEGWTDSNNRNNKTALHCIYWFPLPPFNEEVNSKTS